MTTPFIAALTSKKNNFFTLFLRRFCIMTGKNAVFCMFFTLYMGGITFLHQNFRIINYKR